MSGDRDDVRADLGYLPAPARRAAAHGPAVAPMLRGVDRDGDDVTEGVPKLEPAVVEQGRSWVARLREQLHGGDDRSAA